MENKRKDKSILFLFLILMAIMSISVGYAAVNNIILEIGGTTLAEANKTLHIEYIEKNAEISTGGEFEDYKTENTLLQITTLKLPTENVTKDTNITINVHIKNGSDMSYIFKGVNYLTADDLIGFPSFSVINSNENIKIDSSSYQDYIDEVIEAENEEKSGSMVIPITFKYADITNITDNTLTISLLLKFEKTEDQIYELKTGKNLYSVISSHYTDATNIVFCAKSEIPKGATVLGEAGLTEGEIKAYWGNQTIYIATLTRNSVIKFNADSGYMFSNGNVKTAFSKVKAIEVSNRIAIDTSGVTTMAEMFKGCEGLTNSGIQNFIDKFDTSNVTNMCAMFGSVANITVLDLSGFDTAKVTDMSWMFENNSSLINITFGAKFVTSAVAGTNYNQGMAGMFMNCESLRLLNLSDFDTSNVRSMFRMFENCKNLERIYASDKFKTTSIRAGSNVDVFKNCLKLEGGNGTKYETEQVTDVTYARIDEGTSNPGYFSVATEYTVILDANGGSFANGETIKTYTGINKVEVELDETPTKENEYFIGWTEKKDSKIPMYYAGNKITILKNVTIYAIWSSKQIYTLSTGPQIYSKIGEYRDKTEYVKFIALSELPENSTKIANIDENNIDTQEEGDIQAFYNTNQKTVYFATKTDNAIIKFNKNSSHMFSNGKTVDLAFRYVKTYEVSSKSEIDTSLVEDFSEIFKYNISITQEEFQKFINKFETTSAKNMCAMLEYLPLSTIDISHFDTRNVTDMSWLFHGSSYNNIIFGENFDTSNVTNFDGMFQELKNMVTLDISKFKVKNNATINYMFGLCPKLVNIYVSENSGFENAKSGGKKVFENDVLLVGENGTKYSEENQGTEYARIDTADNPGYFKNIENKNTQTEINEIPEAEDNSEEDTTNTSEKEEENTELSFENNL